MIKDNIKTLIEKTFIESAKNNKGYPIIELHSEGGEDSIKEVEIKMIQMRDIDYYLNKFEEDSNIFLGINYSQMGPRVQFDRELLDD